MKKNFLLPDEVWDIPSPDAGGGTPSPAPSPAADIVFTDEGEPYAFATGAGSGSTGAGTAKPVATIATLADYLVNGFWAYNSALSHHWASNTITYNLGNLNAAEQFLAQSALSAWHDVANINFVQTSGAANVTFTHNGTMQAVTNASWYGSGAMASATVNISTDWVTTDGGANDGKTGIDSYAYQTYIHEIGHALGLGHQGPYNGSANYSTNAIYANDTWQYSIMSYFAESNYSGSSYRYVVTPQMADIYAVGTMYGDASATRTGDTVYGFNSNAGAVFSFSGYTSAPALTIYDSGGSDTLDCSGYSSAQTIDLHAGSFSSVGGLVNNIGIALNTYIEKAIGGIGNDTLIANDLGCTLMGGAGADTLTGGSGADRLIGGSGLDTMTGNGGADTFVFALGDSSPASGQHDRITDFVSGLDDIDLSAIDGVVGTAAIDLFHFLGTAAFDGSAGALDYFYNSNTGLTTLQGDTNGDRVADFAIDLVGNIALSLSDLIGAQPAGTVIESFGATSLTVLASIYRLISNGSGTGPQLNYNGTAITVGSGGMWTPIAAEQTATGYEVAWKATGSNQYMIWNTDTNGAYLSSVQGTAATAAAFESSFHQDLNGDGVISPAATVIDSFGSTSLAVTNGIYYLNSNSSGSGPQLNYNGTPIASGSTDIWTPIAAEQTATGYEVAWKVAGADQYMIWNTDTNGTYLSSVQGTGATAAAFESSFHQDLNGDGIISPAATVIESFGSTSLAVTSGIYYLNSNSSGSGPQLNYNGTPIASGSTGIWTPIAAEQTATGYEVAWKVAGADQYMIWNTDTNGTYLSSVQGTGATAAAFESSFHQDLNGDGIISPAATVIESFGSTSLAVTNGIYYLNSNSSGSGPQLNYNGTPIASGSTGIWTPIAAEQTATGYEVAWKVAGADQYMIWNTDSNGNYLSSVQGTGAAIASYESSFHQDLNGDGATGQAPLATNTVPLANGWLHDDGKFDFKSNFAAPDIGPTSFGGLQSQPWQTDKMTPLSDAMAHLLLLTEPGGASPHDTFAFVEQDLMKLAHLGHAGDFNLH